jgi:hypothetical protein
MSKQAKSNLDELGKVDYTLPNLLSFKWLIALPLCLIMGFLLHFPVGQKIESTIRSSLGGIPGCKITFNELNFEMFLPKVIMTGLTIPGRCGGTPNDIYLKHSKVYFTGLSLSPLGISTSLHTELGKDKLNVKQSVGIGGQAIKIDDNKISLKNLKQYVQLPVDMNGDMNVSTLVELSSGQIQEAYVMLKSTNLMIPAQQIQFLGIPDLAINDFVLKAEQMNPKTIKLNELNIGDIDSPIRASFSGMVYLNKANIKQTGLDLVGEFAVSNKLLDDPKFGLLKMFLGQLNKKDGFYKIKITGTVGQPKTSSL